MESFNLNIIPGKDRPVCHASQFDIGRTIHVNLFEGFNVFTLDGTEVISISVRKPDGNVVTEAVTNTSDSYVEFVTTEQMTACSGSNLCELKLEKGADVIGTMNFILEVEQDPLDGGVQSDTQIHNLQTQVADLVAIEVADQYDSADVIFDNTPTAGHGVGYAVTSEGVKNADDAAVALVENEIAQPYDPAGVYNTGDLCIESKTVYKCKYDNITGAFDPSNWDSSDVATELAVLAGGIDTVAQNIATVYNPNGTYNMGDYVLYKNVFYRCKGSNVTGAWDATQWDQVTAGQELNNIVLKRTLTEMTTGNGNVVNYIDAANGIIVDAICTSQEAIVTHFINSGNTHYSFHVVQPTAAATAVSNTSVTIDFYMIPRRRIVTV